MCILVVDDCAETCLALKDLLELLGYQGTLTASSREEALQVLRCDEPAAETSIHLVLVDVQLPGLDGLETCRRIKATPHLRDIPVLVMTAGIKEELLAQAFEAGASDYLCKPLNTVELHARLRSALALKGELDKRRQREQELLEVTRQLQKLNEELQRLAVLDELTGIANRRYFNMLLNQEWGRATRAVLPLSLVLIDIDCFKRYNDAHGHQKGDECLRKVADCLNAHVKRSGDCVARYGGEEFAVILAHTGLQGAATMAEMLRRSVAELGLEHACSPVAPRVTISLGAASTVPERGGSAEMLLAAADNALYEAKRAGRNQVRLFTGQIHLPHLLLPAPRSTTLVGET
jgi:diguanylate cyclase (GGDEF)-like protein